MAPSVDIEVVELYIWNHFQAIKAGQPLIGGKLYTYQAGTSIPKAAYLDRWLTVPHANPILLDSEGAADIHLNGYYHLRLTDADDVQIWSIDNFTFDSSAPPPAPGDKIVGSSDATIDAVPGAGVIAVPGLVSTGFRCEGLTWTIVTSFGTSNGLTEILIGDNVANDRWSKITNLDAGQSGGQVNFRSDTVPIEPIPYTILLSAISGNFDSVGQIHLRAYWSTLPADTVP